MLIGAGKNKRAEEFCPFLISPVLLCRPARTGLQVAAAITGYCRSACGREVTGDHCSDQQGVWQDVDQNTHGRLRKKVIYVALQYACFSSAFPLSIANISYRFVEYLAIVRPISAHQKGRRRSRRHAFKPLGADLIAALILGHIQGFVSSQRQHGGAIA